ncbi:hypothetical protein [Hanstruepera ponticola]|uniref:hypothetical protein n=1 Tax=Hanstruepera ponticola TaxID=2042995 RepID=UPI00177E8A9D|nr:hypothetical protein [Hanstruepera ponticola]
MKKLFFLFLCFHFTYSCFTQNDKQTIEYDFTGKLNEGQMKFMNNYYNWDSKEILIINFSQPRSDCHFDNHIHKTGYTKWWKDFYEKIDIKDCSNIFVCSEKHNRDKTLFYDKANFLYDNFFSRKESCYGVLVLNKNGDYLQFNGHYTEKQVSKFKENLKSII